MTNHTPAMLPVDPTLLVTAPARRFAPGTGFLCGASYLEIAGDTCMLVWPDGSRVPWPAVSLVRALRLAARGPWVELPAPRTSTFVGRRRASCSAAGKAKPAVTLREVNSSAHVPATSPDNSITAV